MWIERLNPNGLDSAGDTSPTGRFLFSEYFIEAPALFYNPSVSARPSSPSATEASSVVSANGGGVFFAVYGHCCCYCLQGSGAIVHTAPHPLGPWTTLGDVACVPAATSAPTSPHASFLASLGVGVAAEPTPGQGCQYVDPTTTSALRSQQSDIFEVDVAGGGKAFIWAGDRWQQSWDGTKAHDPQLWVPIVFNADSSIAPLRWLDNFTLDIV